MGGSWAKPMVYDEATIYFDSALELPALTQLYKTLSGRAMALLPTSTSSTTNSSTSTSNTSLATQAAPSAASVVDASSASSGITHDAFVNYLVSKGMPSEFAAECARLFACGQPDISYRDFITIMATICKGSMTNKTWVFYQLFDVDHNDSLTRPEFEEGLKQVIDLAESGLYLDLLGVSPSLNDLIAAAKGTANPSLDPTKQHHEHDAEHEAHAQGASNKLTVSVPAVKQKVQHLTNELFGYSMTISAKQLYRWLEAHRLICESIPLFFTRCWAPTYQLPEEFRQVELPRPILTLSGSSELLTPYDRCVIRTWLTGTYADCNLALLFSTTRHGFSLAGMYDRTIADRPHDLLANPSVLVVHTNNGAIFGAFMAERWRKKAGVFHGFNEQNFLFSLRPRTQKFSCNPKHKNHLYTDNERFGIGGYAPNHLAIMLDDELMYGSSSATEAFGNPAFVEDDFRIRSVEVWGLVDKQHLSLVQARAAGEDDEATSVLQRSDELFVLSLIGRGHSQMMD